MMEGGWDLFNNNTNVSFNWSDGNSVQSIGWAIILYVVFILLSKMNFFYSNLVLVSILIIYIINTYKNHLEKKKNLSKETKLYYNNMLLALLILVIIISITGFLNYYLYKKNHYKKSFKLFTFLIGKNKCSSM